MKIIIAPIMDIRKASRKAPIITPLTMIKESSVNRCIRSVGLLRLLTTHLTSSSERVDFSKPSRRRMFNTLPAEETTSVLCPVNLGWRRALEATHPPRNWVMTISVSPSDSCSFFGAV
jgi:hypothetical protein